MANFVRCGLILTLWCGLASTSQAYRPLFGSSSNYYSGYYNSGYYGSYYPSYSSSYYPGYYGSSYYSGYYPTYSSSYYAGYYPTYSSSYYAGYYPTYSSSYYAGYYPTYSSPAYYSSYYPSYGISYYPKASASYYLPSYSYSLPVYTPVVPCAETKFVTPAVYAKPSPAPASQSQEPPTGDSGKPKVKESSTSFYNAVYTNTNGKTANGVCKVGFWNVSNKTVTIQIDDQTQVIPAGKAVTLILPRQFTWQRDAQAPEVESVPSDRATLEIVLR